MTHIALLTTPAGGITLCGWASRDVVPLRRAHQLRRMQCLGRDVSCVMCCAELRGTRDPRDEITERTRAQAEGAAFTEQLRRDNKWPA